MAIPIHELGDQASRDCKPDFQSGKGWAWEKMTREAIQAGTLDNFPHKPRQGFQEECFWGQVDRHMARSFHTVNVVIKDGRVIRE